MAFFEFKDRVIVVGYHHNEYGLNNALRVRPATYTVGDYEYYIAAMVRPVYPSPGKVFYACMPDPEGTITPVHNVGRKIPTTLTKATLAKRFWCPSQWMIKNDPSYPVPKALWSDAVAIAGKLLIDFLISQMAHFIYWKELSVIKPELRLTLEIGDILDKYGPIAEAQFKEMYEAGIPGWDVLGAKE